MALEDACAAAEFEMVCVPRKRGETVEDDSSMDSVHLASVTSNSSSVATTGSDGWLDSDTVDSDGVVDDKHRENSNKSATRVPFNTQSRSFRGACVWSSLFVALGMVWSGVVSIMVLKWLWFYVGALEPLAKWLGPTLRAETEPIFVVLGVIVPFVITGILYYAFRPWSPRLKSSEMPGFATKLRVLRRSVFGGYVDSIDVAVLAVFVLVQMNTLAGKLLIDQYTGKLAKSGYLNRTGRALGMNGFYAVLLSIVLVSRRSFIHEFLNLSSERSAKYHVWLGNFGTIALALHGVVYIYCWWLEGKLAESLIPCFSCEPVRAYKSMRNFSGLVGTIALIVVALASLERVRRQHFRRFTFVHCLNVLFVVSTCLHYYPAVYWFVAPMLVYTLYRVVSVFTRSRSPVVNARVLGDTIVQLQVRRGAAGLRSNNFLPGQYVYIKVDEISSNEWHPITISSSPMRDLNTFALDIKVQGFFTSRLMEMVQNGSLMNIQIDGYYGTAITASSDMVFIAGGSGVTPFLSVLEHLWLLSQLGAGGEKLPSRVWIMWTARDLSLIRAHKPLLDQIRKSAPWETHTQLHWTGIENADCSSVLEGSGYSHPSKPAPLSDSSAHGSYTFLFVATLTGAFVGMALVLLSSTLNNVWWIKRLGLLGAGVFGSCAGASIALWRAKPNRAGFERVDTVDVDGTPTQSGTQTPQTPADEPIPLPQVGIRRSRPDVEAFLRDAHTASREFSRVSDDVRVLVSGPNELQQRVAAASAGFTAPLLSVESRSFTV